MTEDELMVPRKAPGDSVLQKANASPLRQPFPLSSAPYPLQESPYGSREDTYATIATRSSAVRFWTTVFISLVPSPFRVPICMS